MRRIAAAAVLLALAGRVGAGPQDLLWRARHAEKVLGEDDEAIRLYLEALSDKTLGTALQADAHFHLALCYERKGEVQQALLQLAEPIYQHREVPRSLRQRAKERRLLGLAQLLPQRQPPHVTPDPAEKRRLRAQQYVREARAALKEGNATAALIKVTEAQGLDPENAEAVSLAAELKTRLSEVARFVQYALEFVRTWTEARTREVAKRAQVYLDAGISADRKGDFRAAEKAYGEAIRAIDQCEFGDEADDLVALRQTVAEHWRRLRRRHLGAANEEPPIEKRLHRATFLAGFLNQLQRMLDLVSAGGQEYRILPLRMETGARSVLGLSKPSGYQVRRDTPSQWTPVLFAQRYLRRHVSPATWSDPGSLLEAAGGMLLARNRPDVLDALQTEIGRIEHPSAVALRARLVLVSVDREALAKLERHFGPFEPSGATTSRLFRLVVSSDRSLERICGDLADSGVSVRLDRDLFSVDLANGQGQTILVQRAGDQSARGGDLLLDVYPLAGKKGDVSLALRAAARFSPPPVPGKEAAPANPLLVQQGEIFADLPPGATLAVAGLVDPFAAAAGKLGDGHAYLILCEVSPPPGFAATENPPDRSAGSATQRVEIPLDELLLQVRDDPGPTATENAGFQRRTPAEALTLRASFLEGLFRDALATPKVSVENGSLVVPDALRDDAVSLLASFRRQSREAYVIRAQVRAVRPQVYERWLQREHLHSAPLGEARLTLTAAANPEALLRNLAAEPGDVFAPDTRLAAVTALDMQARHILSTRTKTVPLYRVEGDLSAGATREVTEGIRLTVRPYARGGRLRAQVEVVTAALQSQKEELSLIHGVPSYRTRVALLKVRGDLDLGERGHPKSAVIAGIPDPDRTSPERLVELVVALTIRPVE